MPHRLNLARALVLLGFLTGAGSLFATFGHIGDPAYLLTAQFDGGREHAWYHALREGFGDIASMLAVLVIFFGPARYRNPSSWWVCLILLLGYYLPYWVGMPFIPELRAPNLNAELNHIVQAILALAGLFHGRRLFMQASS